MIAASSLGNASVYFENNSASGLGGFTGGAASGPVREKALRMMQSAAAAAAHLQPVNSLPPQQNVEKVTLFTVSGEGADFGQGIEGKRGPQSAKMICMRFLLTASSCWGPFRAEHERETAVAEKSSRRFRFVHADPACAGHKTDRKLNYV